MTTPRDTASWIVKKALNFKKDQDRSPGSQYPRAQVVRPQARLEAEGPRLPTSASAVAVPLWAVAQAWDGCLDQGLQTTIALTRSSPSWEHAYAAPPTSEIHVSIAILYSSDFSDSHSSLSTELTFR